jgi:hypothetical protein
MASSTNPTITIGAPEFISILKILFKILELLFDGILKILKNKIFPSDERAADEKNRFLAARSIPWLSTEN